MRMRPDVDVPREARLEPRRPHVVEEDERAHHPVRMERQHPAHLETPKILAPLVDDELDHGRSPDEGDVTMLNSHRVGPQASPHAAKVTAAAVVLGLLASFAQATPHDAVRAFGGPPLGANWIRLPPHSRREPNCYVSRKFVDCEFAGPDGIHYLVYGLEITRKEVRRAGLATKWPLGLTGRESPAELKAKLGARYGLKFQHEVEYAEEGPVLIAPTPGDPDADSLYFTFSKTGRLMKVTLFVETPED